MQARGGGAKPGKTAGPETVLCPKCPRYPQWAAKFLLQDVILDLSPPVRDRWMEGACVWQLGLRQNLVSEHRPFLDCEYLRLGHADILELVGRMPH